MDSDLFGANVTAAALSAERTFSIDWPSGTDGGSAEGGMGPACCRGSGRSLRPALRRVSTTCDAASPGVDIELAEGLISLCSACDGSLTNRSLSRHHRVLQ